MQQTNRWKRALGAGVRLSLAAAALGVGALLVHGVRRTRQVRVRREYVAVPGLRRPLRVVFASDLHLGALVSPKQVRGWVELMLLERPDFAILGGDLIDRRSAGPQPLPGLLAPLGRLPLGAYWVQGNHDLDRLGSAGAAQLAAHLHGLGIELLSDRAVKVEGLQLVGLSDGRELTPAAQSLLRSQSPGRAVVVSHRPGLLWQSPQPFALGLAGHTHGGQVRLPLVHQDFVSGWTEGVDHSPIFISQGLGVTALPLRVGTTPELLVLELLPAPLRPADRRH